MDFGINGKRALVCGASAGMGLAIAHALAAEGAQVFMCARNPETLEKAVKEVSQKAPKAKIDSVPCDLSDAAARSNLCKTVLDKWCGVDILVHNTGGPTPSTAEDTKMADWQKGFDSLFGSVVALNDAFLPAMKEQKWGRVINVTSLSVLEPIANLAVSNSLRSAVTAYLKTLADELATHGITVNCVAPGSISTGRVEELIEARAKKQNISFDDYMADYIKAIPTGRMGTPEEFAAVVAFIASQQASYITGSTICVDGGKRRSTY